MSKLVEEARRVASDVMNAAVYLDGTGWTFLGEIEGDSVWRREGLGPTAELILPTRPDAVDAARRAGELLTTLSRLERRPTELILQDIATSTKDVIRVRLEPETPSGSAPLNEAIRVLGASRDAVEAAASTVSGPRAVLGPRKPALAFDYARSLETSTEPGSFIVALASTVPAVQDNPIAHLLGRERRNELFDPRLPFSRLANTQFMHASVAAERLVESDALDSPGVSQFEDAVAAGVSANFLESLVRLGTVRDVEESDDPAHHVLPEWDARRPFSISIRWAFSRPDPLLPTGAEYTRHSISVFRRAANTFRARQPQPDTEVSGDLVGSIDKDSRSGIAVIRTFISTSANDKPRWRVVRVALNEEQYEVARHAHADRLRVRVVGDLSTSGRLELRNVAVFEAIDEALEPDADSD